MKIGCLQSFFESLNLDLFIFLSIYLLEQALTPDFSSCRFGMYSMTNIHNLGLVIERTLRGWRLTFC